MIKMLCL